MHIDPATFPAPSAREEGWRFTPVSPVLTALTAEAGKVVVEASAAPGVTVTAIDRNDSRFGAILTPADQVIATAMAKFAVGTAVTVARNTMSDQPTVITVRGEGGGTSFGHLIVDVEEGAEALLVLDHSGAANFFANAEYRLGGGSSLTVVSLQDWDDGSVHVGHHAVLVGRDARFKSFVVSLGGSLVRLATTIAYDGPGGDAELLGLCFADAGQHLEHRLLVDHQAPHCRSRVNYKGALQGQDAHTVWIGDVVIGPKAVGTDTYEVNRNLVLSDGARADSVPNLEILTGEIVGAGHASATGRFDDQQLFYLMSRGIPADEARRLVVRGFFHEIIAQIGVPELRDRLVAAVDAELEGSVL
ncbi:MAG: Fe-S cluster assembly protein SufD [Mycobacteriales bacterium]